MRRALNFMYEAALWLAMLAMVATFTSVMLSIIGRLVDLHLRGLDAYAGYFTAACGFLGLAHTLRSGMHVRVTLLEQHVGENVRRWLARVSHLAGVVLSGAFAWYCMRLAWQSHVLNDISANSDALPLWIPQLSMVLGVVMFFVAIVDQTVALWSGVTRKAVSA